MNYLRISHLVLLGGILLSSTVVDPQPALVVHVSGLKKMKGQLVVAVFKDPETFLEEDLVHIFHKELSETCKVQFKELESGQYAVSVFHDLNGNGELDTNMFGFPTEPYGFSKNASGTFGPPSFQKASFDFPSTNEIRIKLK